MQCHFRSLWQRHTVALSSSLKDFHSWDKCNDFTVLVKSLCCFQSVVGCGAANVQITNPICGKVKSSTDYWLVLPTLLYHYHTLPFFLLFQAKLPITCKLLHLVYHYSNKIILSLGLLPWQNKQQQIVRCHLGLWKTVEELFHCFLTIYICVI